MPMALVHRKGKSIYVIAHKMVQSGLLVLSPPVVTIDYDPANEDLGDAVLHCLHAYEEGAPQTLSGQVYRAGPRGLGIPYSSWTTFDKNAFQVTVTQIDAKTLRVEPWEAAPDGGFRPVVGKDTLVTTSAEPIGMTIKKAFGSME
jgi:hypothetical protein